MTNAAAIGYMILAAKRADIDPELIEVLVHLMVQEMDLTTEEEAEQAYKSN
jgi:hypothetical protein